VPERRRQRRWQNRSVEKLSNEAPKIGCRDSGLVQCRLCRSRHNRHTFAVNTLRDAYRAGDDAEHRMLSLSTYLGHVNPSATYWYLTATPELLGLACKRLERAWEARP
jgi:hypothetical protein